MDKEKKSKSILKELRDQYESEGAELKDPVFQEIMDTSSPSNSKTFRCFCEFLKTKNGQIFKGEGEGSTKKIAENAACQKILDKLSYIEAEEIRKDLANRTEDIPQNENFNEPTDDKLLLNHGRTFVVNSEFAEGLNFSNSKEPQTVISSEELFALEKAEILDEALKFNRIGQLNEYCDKHCRLAKPTYTESTWTDADHIERFRFVCTVGDIKKQGVSASVKMNAKKISAYKVFLTLTQIGAADVCAIPVQPTLVPSTDMTQITPKIFYNPKVRIGEGATAKVFEGYFEIPTKKAAVKICPEKVVHHDKNKELAILRKITHPNIITYFIAEDVGNLTYIVMELAQSTLEDLIKSSQNLDSQLLKKFCTDSTAGLIALHEASIVHRDLKPSNILIFPGNVAKLADFGISKELDSISEGVVTDACKGTRIWMPPEGLRAIGSPISFTLLPSFDIFSLGLTIFYTMMNGRHLFATPDSDSKGPSSPMQIISNIINMQANWDLLKGNEHAALRNVLRSMISLDPRKRPDSKCLLEHPFFWDDRKGLAFILDVSNDIKNNTTNSECRTELARAYVQYSAKTGESKDWKSRLHPRLQDFIKFKDEMKPEKGRINLNLKKYNGESLLKLLEFIRDYNQHYLDWNTFQDGILKQKEIFGEDGLEYGPYFLRVFPELTTLLYTVFQNRAFQGLLLPSFYSLNQEGCYECL